MSSENIFLFQSLLLLLLVAWIRVRGLFFVWKKGDGDVTTVDVEFWRSSGGKPTCLRTRMSYDTTIQPPLYILLKVCDAKRGFFFFFFFGDNTFESHAPVA